MAEPFNYATPMPSKKSRAPLVARIFGGLSLVISLIGIALILFAEGYFKFKMRHDFGVEIIVVLAIFGCSVLAFLSGVISLCINWVRLERFNITAIIGTLLPLALWIAVRFHGH